MDETEPQLGAKLIDQAARVARHPAVQTGVATLSLLEWLHPGVGTISTAIGTGITSVLGARLDRQATATAVRLRDRIAVLEKQGKLDLEQLRTEVESTGIVVKGLLDAAQDTDNKMDTYADLLAGIVSNDRPEQPVDSAVLLSCLSRLDASTIALARHMHNAWCTDPYAVASGVGRPEWGPDTDYHLQHLEAEGLIRPNSIQPALGSSDTYTLTPTLHRLIRTLEAGRLR